MSPTSALWILLSACAAAACTASPADPPAEREETSGEGSDTSDTGASPTGAPIVANECERTSECADEEVCAAPFDPGASAPGPAACTASCIEEDVLQLWCLDDGSCCAGLRCSRVDGFCVARLDDGGTSSSGASSGDSATSGSSDASSGGASSTTTGNASSGSSGTGSSDAG